MALTGSGKCNGTTNGGNGNLNTLCTKNTANEYLDRNYSICFKSSILEHNSNNANGSVKIFLIIAILNMDEKDNLISNINF